MSKIIVLTRPYEDSAKMAEKLEEYGVWSFIEPMLEIEQLPDAKDKIKQQNPDDFDAIIVTSRNAMLALAANPALQAIPVYCVGEETANLARYGGFSIKHEARDAATLQAYLLDNCMALRFLYPSAELVAYDFAAVLPNITQVIVYRSQPAQELTKELVSGLERHEFACIAFFSQASAKVFIELADENKRVAASLPQIDALALSKNIADILQEGGFKSIQTCDFPNRDSMLKLIKQNCVSVN